MKHAQPSTVKPEERGLGQRLGGREQGDDQDVADQGGEVGLDAEPHDRDAATDQGRDLGAADAEADPAHDREGDTGLVAHEPGQAQQDEEEGGPDAEREQDLPGAQAQGEQPHRERVVSEAVHVVGPEREEVVRAPLAPLTLGRGEVVVVEARIDPARDGLVEGATVVLGGG